MNDDGIDFLFYRMTTVVHFKKLQKLFLTEPQSNIFPFYLLSMALQERLVSITLQI